MPLFNSQVVTNSGLSALYPGDTLALFNNEIPLNGQSSIAAALAEVQGRDLVGLAFDFFWPSDPGAFNFRIQGSDDALTDSAYFTEGAGTVVSPATGPQGDGSFRARVELKPWLAKFVRIKVFTQSANGIACTVKVSAL